MLPVKEQGSWPWWPWSDLGEKAVRESEIKEKEKIKMKKKESGGRLEKMRKKETGRVNPTRSF